MAHSARYKRRRRARTDQRLCSSQRGYDHQWRELADWWLAHHPLCVDCLRLGRVNAGGKRRNIVDHITPFNGKDDPLRLQANNLQTLCHTHHQQKTARDAKKS